MTSTTTRRKTRTALQRRPSRTVVFCLVGALLFFFGPAAAYLLGERAKPIDNRPLATLPALSQGWGAVPQFQLWANDHLPLRSQAVKVATGVSQTIFNEAPHFGAGAQKGVAYPKVIEGKDGWLFSGDDVAKACAPAMPVDQIMAGFQKLSDAAVKSGRKIVIMIAPDKSSAHPELLPDPLLGQKCMTEQRNAFCAAARNLRGVTLLDPSKDLAAYEATVHRTAWRTLDTHWSPEGAAVGAKTLAEALDPAIAASSTITVGAPTESLGDLTSLLGVPRSASLRSATLDRPGVEVQSGGTTVAPSSIPDLGYTPTTVTATSTAAPLLPGRTLVIGDSFFRTMRGDVAGMTESLTYVHNLAPDKPGGTEVTAKALAQSDTLVYELVERYAVGGYVSFQKPANVDALVNAMLQHPRG